MERSTRRSCMHFFKSAAQKSTSIRLSLTQAFARLPQLRELCVKIVEPSPVLLDHCRWSSLHERVVLQFCLNVSRLLINPGNFRVQPLSFARMVGGSNREKKFAYGSDCYGSASRRHVFGVERYFFCT